MTDASELDWAGFQRSLARGLSALDSSAEGQLAMAPRPRHGWKPGHVPAGLRSAAGLVAFYPHERRPVVVLTVRDGGLAWHAGQVSFPGGAVEAGESVVDAARREAREEIGLDTDTIRVVGRLNPLHIPVSRFALHPVVTLVQSRPELRPQPGEVARILEVPLSQLCDPACLGVDVERRERGSFQVPYFELDEEKVWGATAMVLSELLGTLGETPEPPWP